MARSLEAGEQKWRCCCGAVHVRLGSLMIGYVELALICFIVVYTFGTYMTGKGNDLRVNVNTVGQMGYNNSSEGAPKYAAMCGTTLGMHLLVVLAMLYGVHRAKRLFLIPHIVLSIVSVFFNMLTLLSSVNDFRVRQLEGKDVLERRWQQRSQFLSTLLGLAVNVWFCLVVWRCFQLFSERRQEERAVAGAGAGVRRLSLAGVIPVDEAFAAYVPPPPPPAYKAVAEHHGAPPPPYDEAAKSTA